MARQSYETKLLREFVQVAIRGDEPHPELIDEMRKHGLTNNQGLQECLHLLKEYESSSYRKVS